MDRTLTYRFAGGATLALVGADAATARHVARQLAPYEPLDLGGDADVVLEAVAEAPSRRFADVQNPARDGLTTAADAATLYVLDGRSACAVPWLAAARPARFAYEPGFPVARVFASLVRPSLQLALLDHDAVAVHSASVEIDGAGVVIAGWSESGKTETALALLEEGARFVSDTWTVVAADGTIGTFPSSVGIRRWALRYLPKLRAALPAGARVQLTAAGLAAAGSAPLRRISPSGRVASLAVSSVERALALADRAALTPTELAKAYGQRLDPARTPPLGTLALLTTVPDGPPSAAAADPTWAARRLARSAAYERRGLVELDQRAAFAFPDSPDLLEELELREEELLRDRFAAARVIEVRTPFPTDPRRVAAVIGRHL